MKAFKFILNYIISKHQYLSTHTKIKIVNYNYNSDDCECGNWSEYCNCLCDEYYNINFLDKLAIVSLDNIIIKLDKYFKDEDGDISIKCQHIETYKMYIVNINVSQRLIESNNIFDKSNGRKINKYYEFLELSINKL